ncbi:thioredoxin family protein [Celerinatantimonas diazotrophica]|uniref:Thioredoxin n=1 Tax=Celerinatantimonas diazotrophica TaxID=412034 RepID=A0A4R1KGR7_9GAMM|nr:co-chaperone YbbN [Celerinatantimonas diazotrophica]TCK63945.1 thioredoxin [Celerinatantimonas diazotrophica]CAG9297030.1 Chaperedoxin [Celerinatantimonas diazotrophica]
MSTAEYIVDITMENAKSILIDRSFETPVVIDFWADWCEPCKDLMPILEKLANEYQGAFILARVNADEMQPLAGQFGIRSLPTVMIMQNGQPVDGFAGAQPEGEIRKILEKYLPKAEDIKLKEAQEFIAEDDLTNALASAKDAWDIDPQRSDIHFMYIRALVANNRWEEAKKLLDQTKLEDQQSEYHELLSEVELLEKAADTPQIKALEKQIAQNPEDDDLKVQLAIQYSQANRNEEALELLFAMLSKNLDSANGEVKQTFLDIINTLSGDPIASKFRRRYFSLLY